MKKIITFNLIVACFFYSCTKEEGEGGSSVITGKVYELTLYQEFNDTMSWWDTIEYKLDFEKEVYIIYSDDENDIYDDSFDTHWNGEYRFEFLRKGNYTIYTYSSYDTSGIFSGSYPIFKHVKINKDNTTFVVDDFIILKKVDD
ncbi:MAG: hypothetical protein VX370_00820 [Bacteroidota bacterium]|nr:hypothetical protein [Bacteroidota bacterium]